MNILEAVKMNSFQIVSLAQYLFSPGTFPTSQTLFKNNNLIDVDSVSIIYLY